MTVSQKASTKRNVIKFSLLECLGLGFDRSAAMCIMLMMIPIIQIVLLTLNTTFGTSRDGIVHSELFSVVLYMSEDGDFAGNLVSLAWCQYNQ